MHGWVGTAKSLRSFCRLLAVCGLLAPTTLHGQSILGRVLDEGDERPISQAAVRVLTPDMDALRSALTDSLGRYRLQVPGPGEYYLVAERLGYEMTRSPLLAVVNPEGVFAVDLSLRPSPLGIVGIEVTAERFAEINQRLHLLVGLSPAALRIGPILRAEIEEHLAQAHTVRDLIQWKAIPSLEIRDTSDGPCFLIRAGARVKIPESCVGVYLNGVPFAREALDALPLDAVEVIVVTMPSESILYPAGAVLLYTAGWIR